MKAYASSSVAKTPRTVLSGDSSCWTIQTSLPAKGFGRRTKGGPGIRLLTIESVGDCCPLAHHSPDALACAVRVVGLLSRAETYPWVRYYLTVTTLRTVRSWRTESQRWSFRVSSHTMIIAGSAATRSSTNVSSAYSTAICDTPARTPETIAATRAGMIAIAWYFRLFPCSLNCILLPGCCRRRIQGRRRFLQLRRSQVRLRPPGHTLRRRQRAQLRNR